MESVYIDILSIFSLYRNLRILRCVRTRIDSNPNFTVDAGAGVVTVITIATVTVASIPATVTVASVVTELRISLYVRRYIVPLLQLAMEVLPFNRSLSMGQVVRCV